MAQSLIWIGPYTFFFLFPRIASPLKLGEGDLFLFYFQGDIL